MTLDDIHHVAIPVSNIADSVEWYTTRFHCSVDYQDPTWALLRFGNTRLALVIPSQHPAHIGLVSDNASGFGPLTQHRDGTRSVYVQDPDGNAVEIVDHASL